MGLFKLLQQNGTNIHTIDWDITPEDTFTMFESWGGKDGERIRNNDEKFYYFFIDSWQNPPQLCLMERGVKHANVVARIKAPRELIYRCVKNQGKKITLDKSYAIDAPLKAWLTKNILENENEQDIIPVRQENPEAEDLKTGLPAARQAKVEQHLLRAEPLPLTDEAVRQTVVEHGFFDTKRNPAGEFANSLIDNGDGQTVTDLVTGIQWQRGGCDLRNHRNITAYITTLNADRHAGHDDWRLPTIEEALSLLDRHRNSKGLYLHPCFSKHQPFVFTADQRKPGGYWFIDFKQGTVFWASGTIPGGFGRACRGL